MRSLLRTLAAAAVLGMVLTGCGDTATNGEAGAPAEDSGTQTPGGQTPVDGAATEESPTAAAATATPGDEVGAAGTSVATASTDLGEVLVDGEGRTLYLFEPDEQGESTCYDDCASSWPPLLTSGDAQASDGADAGLLGTTERTDGTMQVTYDGWPLYHWAGDEQPGDTAGQGVGDVWWVVAPDGTPIRDSAEAGAGEDAADDPAAGVDY